MWAWRAFFVAVPAYCFALACGSGDSTPGSGGQAGSAGVAGAGGSGGIACPGAATACPEECQVAWLHPLTAEGCLGPAEVVACQFPPPPQLLDAGCIKRDADQKLFQTISGPWDSIEGLELCAPEEYGKVILAPNCAGG